MNREEALDRIQKCLALGSSPNENEARTALLMARRLMAKYMISEGEVTEADGDPEERDSSVTCTTVRDPWAIQLGTLIGERHRCRSFVRKGYRKKTMTVSFIGFPKDLDICLSAFEYAAATVRLGIASARMDRARADSYARGFLNGLEAAYREQDRREEGETGMSLMAVTVPPEEVEGYADRTLGSRRISMRSYMTDPSVYDSGYAAGRGHLNEKVRGHPVKQLKR